MHIVSRIEDKRIGSWSLLVECTTEEYLYFANIVKTTNELQRKRVRSAKTVYSLLKRDLLKGCVIPPLVLAFRKKIDFDAENISDDDFASKVRANLESIVILDGLQRTYTLLDAANSFGDDNLVERKQFLGQKIRLEFYICLNKFGVLYRMLTLNTGQTPMSMRQQLEMLYCDYNKDVEYDGVRLVKEVDGVVKGLELKLAFRDVIDGFHSYVYKTEKAIDKGELLNAVNALEGLEHDNIDRDIFREFVECYAKIISLFNFVTNGYELSDDDLSDNGVTGIFGRSAVSIFSKNQAICGYGAAIAMLMEKKVIGSFEDVVNIIDKIKERYKKIDEREEYAKQWLVTIGKDFGYIRDNSSKIGNVQRMYFRYFFRALFNCKLETYGDIDSSIKDAMETCTSVD